MDEWANWQSLMTSAARLQREVPGTVLVGGTAAALLVEHRFSYDADHVVADLKDRYNHVLHHLESLDGWTTARRTSSPPFTILGSLDGQLAGVRQLRRTVPLETQEIQYGSQTLCIPTYEEILRVKGYMVLARNYNRDYVDFLALAGPLPDGVFNEALVPFEMFYETLSQSVGGSGEGLLFDLGMALRKPEPMEPLKGESHHFDSMHANKRPWDLERIRLEGQVQGERVLALWRTLSDNDETRDADTLREHKTLKDRPVRPSGPL